QCVCVNAGRKDPGDGTRPAARYGEFSAGGWAVQRYVSIRVPAAKAVSGQVSKGTEVLAVESNAALRLFGVAGLQLAPLLCDIGTGGLDPWIKRVFHSRLLFFKQSEPGLDPVEGKIREVLGSRRESFPGAMRRHQVSR